MVTSMTRLFRPAACLVIAVLAGCSNGTDSGNPLSPPPAPPPPPPSADVAAGRTAFQNECASCHNSGDGFDLAFFSYPDSTIVRRAVNHVDSATARQIAVYIRQLNTPHVARTARLFQPGGHTVGTDAAFAMALFGQDAWPALTTAQLRSKDPLSSAVAITLPLWSDEGSNLDWLADVPPPAALLSFNANAAANALATYRLSPTVANLTAAVVALRAADRSTANPAAPCAFAVASQVNYHSCFEVRRWTSTLIAQHMVRNGVTQSLGGELDELWWDVGDAARQAVNASVNPIANRSANAIQWMYLAWIFDPSRHETFYLVNALAGAGLPRHAAFVSLRSQVARAPGSFLEHESIYDDLRDAVRVAPNAWTASVATFGLTHILERLNGGERPVNLTNKNMAVGQLNGMLTDAAAKVSSAQLTALQTLVAQVKALL